MFYREGMPGSVLFTGVAMVIYFVVGIRFEEVMLMDTPTSVGKFVVLLLVQIFTAGMVFVYCKARHEAWLILGYSVGITLLSMLFSEYVIPFDVVWVQIIITVAMCPSCVWNGLG